MNKKFFTVLVVALLVGVGVFLGLVVGRPSPQALSPYSAVYLTTGDIYFGKLSWFPKPRLTNVWFVQRTVDGQNQSRLGITPFTSAFWGPADALDLNPKQIVFSARLKAESDVVKAIENPSLFRAPAGVPGANATSVRNSR